jgi:RNase P/RNase MRP subunit POP5
MKRITPAKQEETRYLRFQIHSEEDVEIPELVETFWQNAVNYLGTKTLGEASPWIIANKYDEEKKQGVIRVNRDYETDIRAALIMIEEFEDAEGFIEVKEVSGSLSGLS